MFSLRDARSLGRRSAGISSLAITCHIERRELRRGDEPWSPRTAGFDLLVSPVRNRGRGQAMIYRRRSGRADRIGLGTDYAPQRGAGRSNNGAAQRVICTVPQGVRFIGEVSEDNEAPVKAPAATGPRRRRRLSIVVALRQFEQRPRTAIFRRRDYRGFITDLSRIPTCW